MAVDIRVPEVGESVQEALLAEWFKGDGDPVAADEALFLLETDKITLEVPAEQDGTLSILVPEGSTVSVGDVVGRLEGDGEQAGAPESEQTEERAAAKPPETEREGPEEHAEKAGEEEAEPAGEEQKTPEPGETPQPRVSRAELSPSVRRLVAEHDLDPEEIRPTGPGGRLTKGDVLRHLEGETGRREKRAPEKPETQEPAASENVTERRSVATKSKGDEPTTRKPLSPIRKRIAQRLLESTRNTATLTTFNEIDMGEVQDLRARYKQAFLDRYGVKLGITSFFVKAVVEALEDFPALNAFIEGDDIVQHGYYHVGVAIGAERGLVVPVIRHADRLSFAEIERTIAEFADKVKNNRLELSDLEGGTFSITNGGVFGSLMSTPILNYPQSGILGLHKVEPRPVVVDGEITVRPMMYVALSYDHRIVDGREAVQFLARIKALVEDPERLLVEV